MSLGDLSLACASLLVDELVLGGVRHACVSPGSRSTPITLALARHDGIEVHVHLDERSSAFAALGIARAMGAPVAIACTSGTAAAEFWPAVVEASQARVPLVVLTADRPPRLRGTGANQTIDQVAMYGSYVRDTVETPLPWPDDGATWRQLGARAVRAATARPPGPVHVNLPFEEPLSPSGEAAPGGRPRPGAGARTARTPRGLERCRATGARCSRPRSEGSWSSGPRPSHPSPWWKPRPGWGGPWWPNPPRGCASLGCSRRGRPWSVTPGGSSTPPRGSSCRRAPRPPRGRARRSSPAPPISRSWTRSTSTPTRRNGRRCGSTPTPSSSPPRSTRA